VLDNAERIGAGPGKVMMEMAQPETAIRVITVAPQSGQAVRVSRGELVRVVDVEGHQVGDMWAIDAADAGRWLSAGHTRDRCERLFPALGEQFRDQVGEPILQLEADTSPGMHDMLFPSCDPPLYESRGLPGHPNCRDNFLAAVASAGISLVLVPDPVNLFQNSGPQPDGRLVVRTAASLAGQAITFRALRDLVFVLTSCSVDYPPLNNGHCTPLRIEITPRELKHPQLRGLQKGVRSRPVLARKPSSRPGRYCIRLSRVLIRAVSWARLRLARLARDLFRCDQTGSTGFSSCAYGGSR
jgi:uncharacterized protein YcgI (DUF1989 family)